MKSPIVKLLCACAVSQAVFFNAKAQPTPNTDNIIVTDNAAVITHLTAIAPVETTKSAFMGNKDNLTKKAELELKQQALAKGGNIVYVTSNDFTADANGYMKKVHIKAVVYKNAGDASNAVMSGDSPQKAATSNGSDTTKRITNGVNFSVTGCTGDPAAQTVTIYFSFTNATGVNRSVNVYGGPHSNRVILTYIQKSAMFDDSGNQYECKDDFWLVAGKELPAGLKLNGMIIFSNVLPSVKTVALAKLSVGVSDWDGGGHGVGGVLEFRNLKINWNGAVPEKSGSLPGPNWDTKIKNLNNGIDFVVTGCTGDISAQTVTVFYTFSNPRKSNQRVVVQSGFYSNSATAFDNDGNQYPFKAIGLSGQSSKNQLEKELPTGLTLKGSITFSNVLPSVKGLAMAEIPVVTSNWDGGDNMVNGMIEVKNIAIRWVARPKIAPAKKQ